jgi:hypothetical protein
MKRQNQGEGIIFSGSQARLGIRKPYLLKKTRKEMLY